ncbi:hypothetical protein PSACC_02222 [Paramicrosporidium saccamoebae]|uniref:Uncharacterized protein n=1 Tax=Paramicrosporidium saccamoebae TaxID=1246581 RepID=A0A2H9TJK9_9FUNG|nr:hypothetical protein PSACC_02222 [Paramicrosporidium saccamoebae]
MQVAASLDLDQIRQLAETLESENWRTEEILRRGLPSFPPPRFTPSDFPFQLSSSSLSGLAVEVSPGLHFVRVRRLHRADFDVLQKLFQERPVWLRSALVNYLPNVGPTEFRAYFFYQVAEMRASRIQSMIEMFPASLRKAADSAPENGKKAGMLMELSTGLSDPKFFEASANIAEDAAQPDRSAASDPVISL